MIEITLENDIGEVIARKEIDKEYPTMKDIAFETDWVLADGDCIRVKEI